MRRAAGFTLIEMMVVIAVIAVAVTSLAVRGFAVDDSGRALARLRQLLEFAADRAEIGGTPIAVDFEPGGYRFFQLDANGRWLPARGDPALATPRLEPDLRWRGLELSGVAAPPRLIFAGRMPDFVLRVAVGTREASLRGRPNGQVIVDPPAGALP